MLLLLAALVQLSSAEAPTAAPLDCGPTSASGYRSGLCNGCACCPLRWSCLEQHSRGYNCAERTSVPVRTLHMALPNTWIVGETVSEVVDVPQWVTVPACHSVLPPGLNLRLEAGQLALVGTVQFDPARPAGYVFDLEVARTISNSSTFITQRVLGSSSVHVRNVQPTNPPHAVAAEGARASSDAAANAARTAGQAGFGAFESYYQHHALSHNACISAMYGATSKLASVVSAHPSIASGMYWNWLGAMYMSMHKLLEDVLVDGCEHHFEQALLYEPSDESLQTNLAGAYLPMSLSLDRSLVAS
jgi:hypothetical protein